MEPIKIPLSKPIVHGSTEIKELVIERELEAGDLRSLPMAQEQQNMGHVIDIMGKLAGQPPSVMNKLSAVDMSTISEVFQRFF